MNRAFAVVLLSAALLAAAGCAVQGSRFVRVYTPPDEAVIYVYRPYSYAGSLLDPPVTCGRETARIGPGGYYAFVVPARHVVCTVQGAEATDEVEIDPQPRVHYLKEEIGWGLLRGHPHLNPMDADKANVEIQTCCVQQP